MRATLRHWRATGYAASVHKQEPYALTLHTISSQTRALRPNTAHYQFTNKSLTS